MQGNTEVKNLIFNALENQIKQSSKKDVIIENVTIVSNSKSIEIFFKSKDEALRKSSLNVVERLLFKKTILSKIDKAVNLPSNAIIEMSILEIIPSTQTISLTYIFTIDSKKYKKSLNF